MPVKGCLHKPTRRIKEMKRITKSVKRKFIELTLKDMEKFGEKDA
tara:strand:- start:2685 stop:2819 length:135 start_codon:yes stop_codon:yes gene_type:complete